MHSELPDALQPVAAALSPASLTDGVVLLEPTVGGTENGQALVQQPGQTANARIREIVLTTGRPALAITAEAAHINTDVGCKASSAAVLGGHDASLRDVQSVTHSPAGSVVASAAIATADSDTINVSTAAQAPATACATELSQAKLHHLKSTDNAHLPSDGVSASVVPKPADAMPIDNSSATSVTASLKTAAPSKPTLVSDKSKSI